MSIALLVDAIYDLLSIYNNHHFQQVFADISVFMTGSSITLIKFALITRIQSFQTKYHPIWTRNKKIHAKDITKTRRTLRISARKYELEPTNSKANFNSNRNSIYIMELPQNQGTHNIEAMLKAIVGYSVT